MKISSLTTELWGVGGMVVAILESWVRGLVSCTLEIMQFAEQVGVKHCPQLWVGGLG